MRTRIQKWGSSLALRIPKVFAAEARISEGTPVELTLVEGRLFVSVVEPLVPEPQTLDQLLRGVTDQNLPGEWNTGRSAGREFW